MKVMKIQIFMMKMGMRCIMINFINNNNKERGII